MVTPASSSDSQRKSAVFWSMTSLSTVAHGIRDQALETLIGYDQPTVLEGASPNAKRFHCVDRRLDLLELQPRRQESGASEVWPYLRQRCGDRARERAFLETAMDRELDDISGR